MDIINLLLNIDPTIYVLLFGGAAGVSLLTQWVKKFFEITNEKHIVAVLNLFALIASGLQYFITSSDLPPTILGVSTVLLTGIATPLYIYIIKPLNTFIINVNLYKNRVLEKVESVEAVIEVEKPVETITIAPVEPITTVPITTIAEELPVADF